MIKTDRAIGDNWLVSDGVAAGDKVIVIGLQSAKAGSEVKPSEASIEQLNQPAAEVGAAAPAPGAPADAAKPAANDGAAAK